MARRRTPIFTAMDGQQVGSGLQPDRHDLLKVLWESAANVVFWNGTVRRKLPAALAFDLLTGDRVAGVGQQESSDGSRWVWAGSQNEIMRWRFGAGEVITNTFGSWVENQTATQRPTLYDFTSYGDWMIVNAGQPAEPAKIFKPGSPYTFNQFAPGQAPVGVCCFKKLLSFIMAIGYGPRGTQVGWSDANNVELWTAAADNTAGSLSIDEFNTPIRAAAKLGSSLAVFSEDQMAVVSYIGGSFIFGQRVALDGIGCVGKAALASDGKTCVGVSRAGCWWTDGNSQRYIDEGYTSNYFQDNVNWDQASLIVVGRNDYTGCFEFHFPMRGSLTLNEAWSFDPRNSGWTPIPVYTAFDERRLFNHVLYGGGGGRVRFGDFNPSDVGPLTLETKPIVMSTSESPHVITRVDEVDLLLHEAAGIEYRIGCADEPNGDWLWSRWEAVEAGAKVLEVPANDDGQSLPEAAYWKLALRSVVDNWALDLQGFLLYGIATGSKM